MTHLLADNFTLLELNLPKFLNLFFMTGTAAFALLAVAVKLAGNDD
jgi:hypothetical protein